MEEPGRRDACGCSSFSHSTSMHVHPACSDSALPGRLAPSVLLCFLHELELPLYSTHDLELLWLDEGKGREGKGGEGRRGRGRHEAGGEALQQDSLSLCNRTTSSSTLPH